MSIHGRRTRPDSPGREQLSADYAWQNMSGERPVDLLRFAVRILRYDDWAAPPNVRTSMGGRHAYDAWDRHGRPALSTFLEARRFSAAGALSFARVELKAPWLIYMRACDMLAHAAVGPKPVTSHGRDERLRDWEDRPDLTGEEVEEAFLRAIYRAEQPAKSKQGVSA